MSNQNRSLFQPAGKAQRHLKVLLHGGPGTGKTRAALSFPGPVAVLDLEGGTALYEGEYQVLRTKDIRVIEQAINELAKGQYQTVVVDPLTVLWHLLQDAGQALVDRRRDSDSLQSGQALSPREWGIIKRKYNSLLTRLINLPMHVVLIARDSDQYEGTGDALKKVGVKADVEKGTPYLADVELSLETETGRDGVEAFVAVVKKSRAAGLPKGARLTGYGADPGQGLYPKHLAKLTSATTEPDLALQDDSAVMNSNAEVLEDEGIPAPRFAQAPQRTERPPAVAAVQSPPNPPVAASAPRVVAPAVYTPAPVPGEMPAPQGDRKTQIRNRVLATVQADPYNWTRPEIVQALQTHARRSLQTANEADADDWAKLEAAIQRLGLEALPSVAAFAALATTGAV